jgi:hypothetical protein
MSENKDVCPQCNSEHFHRVPQMPFLKRSEESRGGKVGEKVKAAIEENRAVLEHAKKEARNNNWEPKNDN